jgi:hypothetical protein
MRREGPLASLLPEFRLESTLPVAGQDVAADKRTGPVRSTRRIAFGYTRSESAAPDRKLVGRLCETNPPAETQAWFTRYLPGNPSIK